MSTPPVMAAPLDELLRRVALAVRKATWQHNGTPCSEECVDIDAVIARVVPARSTESERAEAADLRERPPQSGTSRPPIAHFEQPGQSAPAYPWRCQKCDVDFDDNDALLNHATDQHPKSVEIVKRLITEQPAESAPAEAHGHSLTDERNPLNATIRRCGACGEWIGSRTTTSRPCTGEQPAESAPTLDTYEQRQAEVERYVAETTAVLDAKAWPTESENCEFTAGDIAAAEARGDQAGYLRGLREAAALAINYESDNGHSSWDRACNHIHDEIRKLIEKAENG